MLINIRLPQSYERTIDIMRRYTIFINIIIKINIRKQTEIDIKYKFYIIY